MTRPNSLILLALCFAGACASPRTPPPAIQETTPQATRPLGFTAAQRVMVLPAHYVRGGDSLGWAAGIAEPREFLRALDDELAFALRERGLGTSWIYPAEVARSAKRAVTMATDPYALAADVLRPGATTKPILDLPAVFASQVRNLVALQDNVRFALLPVEMRFEKVEAGGRAQLRVVLIDARLSRVVWSGDVASDTALRFSPALSAGIASKVADLIAAP